MSVRTIVLGRIFRFPSRKRCGARLLKSANQFTAYSPYPIELKLGRLILYHQFARSLGIGLFKKQGRSEFQHSSLTSFVYSLDSLSGNSSSPRSDR